MPELATGPRGLAVEMEVGAGDPENRGSIRNVSPIRLTIAETPLTAVGAQAAARDRAQMVLELARLGAFDRPVPRVVDARRHLVGEQLALVLEQLDREHADVVERLERLCGDGDRLRRRALRAASGAGAIDSAQDAVAVHVFDERPVRGLAGAAARGEDRQLALERDERLRGSSGRPPSAANAESRSSPRDAGRAGPCRRSPAFAS